MKRTRFIFITGGVVSSLGKGVTAASLAALLQSRGYLVRVKKLDPYLNVDPGTMSPYQHGEVFVTDDGGEADLDLGHYERFTGINAKRSDSITSGKIYSNLIAKERAGEYLGGTVQVIPHVTDLIKDFVLQKSQDEDFVICEIGGTVGDIEALPYFEAIRQLGYELGKECVLYMHLTLLPYLSSTDELKTKPTQHSVKELRSIGIQPDILICRAEKEIHKGELKKIALLCSLKENCVISALDCKNINLIPLIHHEKGLDEAVLNHFEILYSSKKADLTKWFLIRDAIDAIDTEGQKKVKIGLVGKYNDMQDAYKSLVEALNHAGFYYRKGVHVAWIDDDQFESDLEQSFLGLDGIIVPGGFGKRGVGLKMDAIRYAREKNIPFFGICFGMQLALIEYAKNVLNIENATSSEFLPLDYYNKRNNYSDQNDCVVSGGRRNIVENNNCKGGVSGVNEYSEKDSKNEKSSKINHNRGDNIDFSLIVCKMEEWSKNGALEGGTNVSGSMMGGTMRLGAYECCLQEGSKVARIYGAANVISERHRHRYEFNPAFREQFERSGMRFSGFSKDNKDLVEVIELPGHSYFVAVQFHPELKSRPFDPHPLFIAFVGECIKNSEC